MQSNTTGSRVVSLSTRLKSPESRSNGGEHIQCNTARNHTDIREYEFLDTIRPLVVASHTGRGGEKRKVTFPKQKTHSFQSRPLRNHKKYLLNFPHIKNGLVLLVYLESNIARLNLSPLPRTMFFSNDIRQVQNRKPAEALVTTSHLIEGKFFQLKRVDYWVSYDFKGFYTFLLHSDVICHQRERSHT